MALVDVIAAPGFDADVVLGLVGAVEHASEHPVAKAIAGAAVERSGSLQPVESFTNHEGLGVQGVVGGHAVVAGRPKLLARSVAPSRTAAWSSGPRIAIGQPPSTLP